MVASSPAAEPENGCGHGQRDVPVGCGVSHLCDSGNRDLVSPD